MSRALRSLIQGEGKVITIIINISIIMVIIVIIIIIAIIIIIVQIVIIIFIDNTGMIIMILPWKRTKIIKVFKTMNIIHLTFARGKPNDHQWTQNEAVLD